MDRLSQLPGELIEGICTFLPNNEDLQRFRLCCKRLKEASNHAFDERHLRVVKGELQSAFTKPRRNVELLKDLTNPCD